MRKPRAIQPWLTGQQCTDCVAIKIMHSLMPCVAMLTVVVVNKWKTWHLGLYCPRLWWLVLTWKCWLELSMSCRPCFCACLHRENTQLCNHATPDCVHYNRGQHMHAGMCCHDMHVHYACMDKHTTTTGHACHSMHRQVRKMRDSL